MRVSRVFLVVIVATALGWLAAFYAAESGWVTPSLGYPSVITLAAATVLELIPGIRVLRDRERPVADRMNPLAAARTLVLARPGFTGAAVGWHLGILVHRPRRIRLCDRRSMAGDHRVDPGDCGFYGGTVVPNPPEDPTAMATICRPPNASVQPTTRQTGLQETRT